MSYIRGHLDYRDRKPRYGWRESRSHGNNKKNVRIPVTLANCYSIKLPCTFTFMVLHLGSWRLKQALLQNSEKFNLPHIKTTSDDNAHIMMPFHLMLWKHHSKSGAQEPQCDMQTSCTHLEFPHLDGPGPPWTRGQASAGWSRLRGLLWGSSYPASSLRAFVL